MESRFGFVIKIKYFLFVILFFFILSGISCSTDDSEESVEYQQPTTPEGGWLLGKIAVLETVSPNVDDLTDLNPLTDNVGHCKVVGVGEASHGTSEFFQMKHRILKTLVMRKNFKLFIPEQDFITTYQLNNYIVKNQGSAYTWFYYIPMGEYFDLIEWMHDYNVNKNESEKIWIWGCDILSYNKHISYVKDVLEGTDLQLYEIVSQLYDGLSSYSSGFDYGDMAMESEKEKIRTDINTALDEIVREKDSLILKLGKWDYDILERAALVVIQSEDFYSHKDFPAVRDKYMFENIVWIMAKFGNAKTVHSSHNEHISIKLRDDIYNREWDSTGFYLKEKFGDGYSGIGLTFYEGSFHIWWGTGSVGPPIEGSYEYYFEQAKRPLFSLHLKGLDYGTSEGNWIGGPRMFRHIDERFTADMPEEDTFNIRPMLEDFDWIIYIKDSTPYRLIN